MQKHSARLKNKGFHKLEVIEVKTGKSRKRKLPTVAAFILNYFDKSKQLSLHPTKGYRLESVNR